MISTAANTYQRGSSRLLACMGLRMPLRACIQKSAPSRPFPWRERRTDADVLKRRSRVCKKERASMWACAGCSAAQ